jgi:hypothetical protein
LPYQSGNRLSGERASRIGHLDVVNSEFAKRLIRSFEETKHQNFNSISWENIPDDDLRPLKWIYSVDGSNQSIVSDRTPYKRIAFVKTALLRLNLSNLSKIDKTYPHPLALRDILVNQALFHSTVFPLQNVSITNYNNYHAIRHIIYESVKDPSLKNEPMETLKWIVYEKWNEIEKEVPEFQCPHCERDVATLPYDQEIGQCPNCKEQIFLTDMLGFHQVMAPDSAPDSVANDYMAIHETLLLFTGIRYFWENRRSILSDCLFVKDGPLSIRAQYSKLVNPIRRFLKFAKEKGYPIHILGQEKSGRFFDHLQMIGKDAPDKSIFIPSDHYIKEQIQHRPITGAIYGKDTNYGAKIFVSLNRYHQMIINIPTGVLIANPTISDLIGVNRIFSTIPFILSNRREGGLLPIELAHGIASLSTYPSAHILKLFTQI